jgi:hypothetical protein
VRLQGPLTSHTFCSPCVSVIRFRRVDRPGARILWLVDTNDACGNEWTSSFPIMFASLNFFV